MDTWTTSSLRPDLPDIRPLGDCAARVTLGEASDPALADYLRRFCAGLEKIALPGVREWLPAYTSVTVFYAPALIGWASLCAALRQIAAGTDTVPEVAGQIVELPVRYGGADGSDLPALAARHGLSVPEVIALHAAPLYAVVLVGFLPGFPYLHGLPDALHTPRRDSPRLHVPAGSVGIGGAQTGVYPCASPGGWHLIGRTETPLFDVSCDPPSLLKAGDRVRFVPM